MGVKDSDPQSDIKWKLSTKVEIARLPREAMM